MYLSESREIGTTVRVEAEHVPELDLSPSTIWSPEYHWMFPHWVCVQHSRGNPSITRPQQYAYSDLYNGHFGGKNHWSGPRTCWALLETHTHPQNFKNQFTHTIKMLLFLSSSEYDSSLLRENISLISPSILSISKDSYYLTPKQETKFLFQEAQIYKDSQPQEVRVSEFVCVWTI